MPSATPASPWWENALISDPIHVLALLLGILATVFALQRTRFRVVYRVIPILVFCYFVPTILSNTGVIPSSAPSESAPSYPLYAFIMDWLLPSSLLLLVLAVDVRAILRLGKPALVLFLTAAVSVTVGGPLAYLGLGWLVDDVHASQVWRGLAALCGSWIGGGANFAAIGRSVEMSSEMFGVIVVIDVAISNLWLMVLLFFADRHRAMDASIGADSSAVDDVQARAEAFASDIAAPTDLPALLSIAALSFGGTALASVGAEALVDVVPKNDILSAFAWKIMLVTALGLGVVVHAAAAAGGQGSEQGRSDVPVPARRVDRREGRFPRHRRPAKPAADRDLRAVDGDARDRDARPYVG